MSQEGRIEMSQAERDVLSVMTPVVAGKRSQAEAARLLQMSVQQVRRLQRRLAGSSSRIGSMARGSSASVATP